MPRWLLPVLAVSVLVLLVLAAKPVPLPAGEFFGYFGTSVEMEWKGDAGNIRLQVD